MSKTCKTHERNMNEYRSFVENPEGNMMLER
jgi:hypothetical protein